MKEDRASTDRVVGFSLFLTNLDQTEDVAVDRG
jgi:hypothetical protein